MKSLMLARLAVLNEPSPEALVELKKLKTKLQTYRLILERHESEGREVKDDN